MYRNPKDITGCMCWNCWAFVQVVDNGEVKDIDDGKRVALKNKAHANGISTAIRAYPDKPTKKIKELSPEQKDLISKLLDAIKPWSSDIQYVVPPEIEEDLSGMIRFWYPPELPAKLIVKIYDIVGDSLVVESDEDCSGLILRWNYE